MGHHVASISVNHIHSSNKRMLVKRDANPSCKTGGFYKSPASNAVVNSSDPFTMSWDNTCLDTQKADIHLFASGANQAEIQIWENVDFTTGTYQTNLEPKWWNDTSSIGLQITIVPAGIPLYLNSLPAGPTFTGVYTPPSDGSTPSDAGAYDPNASIAQNVDQPSAPSSSSKGKIAAGVLVPLLIIALAAFGYIRYKRMQRVKKAKRFSQAVDQRMSTIAPQWRPVTIAGAEAAVRASMAFSGNRSSSASFGARPSSTLAVESGQAGIGAMGLHNGRSSDEESPEMSQIRRPGVGPRSLSGSAASSGAARASRVSFAADTRFSRIGDSRPSLEARRAGAPTRSFHTSIVPPVPTRRPSDSESDDANTLSPTQTQGPFALSPEDIQAHISGQASEVRPSLDLIMPALSMMRTGDANSKEDENDYILSPRSPSPTHGGAYLAMPTPPPVALKSPIIDVMPMQPMPANVMSPDDMLRAYAEQRKMGVSSPTYPAPVAGNGPTTMRTLYAPQTPTSMGPVGSNNPFRMSMIPPDDHYNQGFNNDAAYGVI